MQWKDALWYIQYISQNEQLPLWSIINNMVYSDSALITALKDNSLSANND